jgi:hypothetical protein
MSLKASFTIVAALAGRALSQVPQDFNPVVSLMGCAEVGCPQLNTNELGRDWDTANCVLGGVQLNAVGIAASVISVPNTNFGLSVTIARTNESVDTNLDRSIAGFNHAIYVSKPSGFDLAEQGSIGCALIWQQNLHTFNVAENLIQNNTDCAFTSECQEDLSRHVKEFQYDAANPMPRCEALAWSLTRKLSYTQQGDFRCRGFNWGTNLTGVAFLGPDAPRDLVMDVGETNCRPTFPRLNEMVKIADQTVIVENKNNLPNIYNGSKPAGLDGQTPMVTIIYAEDTVSVQAMCMRVLGNAPFKDFGGKLTVPIVTAFAVSLGVALSLVF